jgi:hypothetical protein
VPLKAAFESWRNHKDIREKKGSRPDQALNF